MSGGLAQSVECDVRNVEAAGSKPAFSNFLILSNTAAFVHYILSSHRQLIKVLRWCSWLSRVPHTHEVPSSILGWSSFCVGRQCRLVL